MLDAKQTRPSPVLERVWLRETICMQGVFNPNIPIFASNSAEGLHFSAFHFKNVFLVFILSSPPHARVCSRSTIYVVVMMVLQCNVRRYVYHF